jgi:DNA-binding NtrC family response regulator
MPVLILGETGTGKELVARALHRTSPRHAGPFVAVNCGAVPATLFEAQCFGHERGALTDAQARHAGWFEQAHHGTLFLDDVGEMPVESQVKLLRVIEQQEVVRLGGEHSVRVEVRVIAATNEEIEPAVGGRFRKDLYYRLAARVLRLPPLRDRPGDVAIIARHVLTRLSAVADASAALSPEAVEALERHPWPGNVRELEHAIEQAFADAEGGLIRESHLPLGARRPAEGARAEDFVRAPGVTLPDASRAAVDRLERRWILEALQTGGGSRTKAALILGIDRKTLFEKMRKYAIEL